MDFKAMRDSKAVETLPDGTEVAAFQKDFFLDTKSMEQTIDDNGDLWIEGYASDFGIDRQDEAFEPGAFEKGLKAFLETNPIMLFHHSYDKALGIFTDAKVDENGLWVRGRVDKPAPGSWAEDVFNKIRRGTIKAFSVGGIFKRRHTKAGPKIYEADLGEISVTPFPVNPRTTFAVVAKKAFENAEGKAEGDRPKDSEQEGGAGDTHVETPADEQPTATPGDSSPASEQEEEAAAAGAEEEGKEQEEEVKPLEVTPGAITAEYIAPGTVGVEHLADDLRDRFAELRPEAPSVEEAHAKIAELVGGLETVYDHIGITREGEDARLASA